MAEDLSESRTETDAPEKGRDVLWMCAAVFALAFFVRGIHVFQLRSATLFDLKLGDARSYHDWALRIAGGDWLGSEVFYQAPLYPYFLAAIYSLFGEDAFNARMVQALIGSFACVFLALAGRRFFSPAAGVAAGAILALYAPAVFFDGLFQKSVLDMFFLCFLLWMLSGLVHRIDLARCGFAGAGLGCFILTRENALLFAPAILLWLLAVHRGRRREVLLGAVSFVLALSIVLLPVAARNYAVGGEFQLTTSAFGSVFYIGNNENATGDYVPLRAGRGSAKYELSDAMSLAEQDVGHALTPAEMSRYWGRKALDYIVNNPADWLRLMGKKVALVISATETVDTEDQYTHADSSVLLRLSGFVFNFGVLAPLAIFGVWVSWPQRKRLSIIYLLAAIYLASILLFWVNARYRYPLVPFLILLAAAGLPGARPFFRRHSRRYLTACLLTVAVTALAVNLQRDSMDAMRSVTEQNIGNELRDQGRIEEAAAHYEKSLEYLPNYALAHNGLGLVLRDQGRNDLAKARFTRAIELQPDYAEPYDYLGIMLLAEGAQKDAIEVFRQGLTMRPDYLPLYNNLAGALYETGEREEAEGLYREAIARDPQYAKAHYNLGMLLHLAGNNGEAMEHLRAAVRLRPDWQVAKDALATAESVRP